MAVADQDFVEFVETTSPSLRRTAYLICGDRHKADDIVQDALYKLYVAWPRVRRVGNQFAYEDTYELALTKLIKALGGTQVPTATREVQTASAADTGGNAPAASAPATAPAPAVSEEALRKLGSVRDHLTRYRELSSQGKWAEAGKELDEIQSLVQK